MALVKVGYIVPYMLDERTLMNLAVSIVANCMTSGSTMKMLNAGKEVASKTGDYSDVTIIDAEGNKSTWAETAKILHKDMDAIKKDVTDHIYTFLTNMGNELYLDDFLDRGKRNSINWEEPELITPDKP